MFDIEMEFVDPTSGIEIRMPYVAFLKMFHVITERIHPEDLTAADSLGESVLVEFVKQLFALNSGLIEHHTRHESQDAIEEAETIVSNGAPLRLTD